MSDDFETWLRENDASGERRLVHRGAGRLVVSKVDDGFGARLHAALARLPELFDEATVRAAYASVASGEPALRRVAAWQRALERLLSDGVARGALAEDEQNQITIGIDSVAVVLDAILWSQPAAGDRYEPQLGEAAAYRETLARMDATPGLFTRTYGRFAGATVESHCAAPQVARLLLAQGWRICTGSEPPQG